MNVFFTACASVSLILCVCCMHLALYVMLSVYNRGTAAALGSNSRVQCTLQAATPADKHDWLLALQNAKLALGRLSV